MYPRLKPVELRWKLTEAENATVDSQITDGHCNMDEQVGESQIEKL